MASSLIGSDILLLLLLSGPIAVGKSAVARELVENHAFKSIRSGAYLKELAAGQGANNSRAALQQLGDKMDEKTDYRWLVDDVAVTAVNSNPRQVRWLVDSVRKKRQVDHFRTQFGRSVLHVHLVASEAVLRERYTRRLSTGGGAGDDTSYENAIAHTNETSARALIDIADIVIDAAQTAPAKAAKTILIRSRQRGE